MLYVQNHQKFEAGNKTKQSLIIKPSKFPKVCEWERKLSVLASTIVTAFAWNYQCMECDACLYNYVKFMQNLKPKCLITKEIFALLK